MQRTFLVTYTSKEIGLALARRLVADSHRVVGLARHTSETFPSTLVPVNKL